MVQIEKEEGEWEWVRKDTGLPYEWIDPETGVSKYLRSENIESHIEYENKYSFYSFDIDSILDDK